MKKTNLTIAILLCFASFGCCNDSNSATKRLYKLFDEQLEFSLQENPIFATTYGDHRSDDKLSQVSLNDIERRQKQTESFLSKLKSIDRSQLSQNDKLNYDLAKKLLEDDIKWHQLKSYLMPIDQMGGFYTSFARLPEDLTFKTVKDYENYIARLNAFERYTGQYIDLMRMGIKEGMVPPKILLQQIPKTIRSLIAEDINESVLYEPFKNMPENLNSAQVRSDGRKAIQDVVRPAYKKILEFITDEYIPAGRDDISIYGLPNGREYYLQSIHDYTTLELTPEQIHEIGIAEVKRIKNEMIELIARTDFKGNFEEFKKYVQTDKRFRADNAEEMLMQVAWIMKKTDGELPKLFKTLPRMPVGIKKVPPYTEATSPIAYYSGPSLDKTKSGFYYVNTYDVTNKSLYNLTATTLHETNPGHHLQIALAQEMNDLPLFRRMAGFTAYLEGWALYAEQLGEEMGIYENEYSRFGKLDNDMWRACRLVVDTGIHHFGWTREKAIDYMLENTSLDKDNVIVEVNRYIAWPGQALSYKIGELKIQELRRMAEKQFAGKFDIREFHNVILRQGALPLDILQQKVEQWLSSVRN